MNPIQIMQQFQQFQQSYKGMNPEQEAKQLIAQSNLSQKQLNELQNTANMIFKMGKQMKLF